ncbi:cysteine-rich receptor-like protein kinase [Trifolium pratense]|uniref:Cysteine-rich receptor-like protein kinase n=1 Tax=Trifolium pratense TaxID=57577 RepID=A0A2K3MXH8_TRIPR|nr:cysteine-rich receptor-like protein kinase [Trifolium pratense]
MEGERRGSLWWREIASIREGGGAVGGRWIGDHVVRRVGNGADTFFWTDPWLDGVPLCERFGRLFVLGAETKPRTVVEMFSLGWGTEGTTWVWQRQLRACQSLLSNFSFQAQSSDRWQWQPDPDTSYIVRGAYHLLTTLDSITLDEADHLIWHPQVPLKVSIFASRLLCDDDSQLYDVFSTILE